MVGVRRVEARAWKYHDACRGSLPGSLVVPAGQPLTTRLHSDQLEWLDLPDILFGFRCEPGGVESLTRLKQLNCAECCTRRGVHPVRVSGSGERSLPKKGATMNLRSRQRLLSLADGSVIAFSVLLLGPLAGQCQTDSARTLKPSRATGTVSAKAARGDTWAVVWLRGEYRSFTDYNQAAVGLIPCGRPK